MAIDLEFLERWASASGVELAIFTPVCGIDLSEYLVIRLPQDNAAFRRIFLKYISFASTKDVFQGRLAHLAFQPGRTTSLPLFVMCCSQRPVVAWFSD
jgi:hypothetical protein